MAQPDFLNSSQEGFESSIEHDLTQMTISQFFKHKLLPLLPNSEMGIFLLADIQWLSEGTKMCRLVADVTMSELFQPQRSPDSASAQPNCIFTERYNDQEKALSAAKFVKQVGQNIALSLKKRPADIQKSRFQKGWGSVQRSVSEGTKKSKSTFEKLHTIMASFVKSEVSVQETLDEVGIYLLRTIQLIWLAFKVGYFDVMPLEMTDVAKLQVIQLGHRVRVSTMIMLQMLSEVELVSWIQSLDYLKMLRLKVSLESCLEPAQIDQFQQLPTQEELLKMAHVCQSNNHFGMPEAQVLEALSVNLKNMVMNNALYQGSQLSSRPLIKEILQNFFPGSHTVSLDLLVQALTTRLQYEQQIAKGDIQGLSQGLSSLLGFFAQQGPKNTTFQDLKIQSEASLPLSTNRNKNLPFLFKNTRKTHDLKNLNYLGSNISIQSQIPKSSAAYPTQCTQPILQRTTSILVQDLIFLSDFVGIPELILLFEQESQQSIEKMLFSQMDMMSDNVIKHHMLQNNETSLSILQQPNSVCFIICLLSFFGFNKIKLDRASRSQHNEFKLKLQSITQSKAEVAAISTICDMHFQSQNLTKVLTTPTLKLLQDLHLLPDPYPQKRNKEPLHSLQIQNLLSQRYHFLKWQTIELMEVQQREMQHQHQLVLIENLIKEHEAIIDEVQHCMQSHLSSRFYQEVDSEPAELKPHPESEKLRSKSTLVLGKKQLEKMLENIQACQDQSARMQFQISQKWQHSLNHSMSLKIVETKLISQLAQKVQQNNYTRHDSGMITNLGGFVSLSSMKMKLESFAHAKLLECIKVLKFEMRNRLQSVQPLLIQVDRRMLQERTCLVNLLKYVGGGIETRELDIKNQFALIAQLEMEKGKDEDALQEQTCKTLEVINIADIALEKIQLEKAASTLQKKQLELDQQENELLREQRRRDFKKAKAKKASEINNKAD